ncbi:MAG: nickel pincer cofactor biosynthesis protein LarC [Peptococcaceae bacterium]|nr:nickel pincer cofactor biosynthesis protein LarC [Peptococcaceae bacterium]
MKVLYYDCFSGISGDMNLGALVDLGVDREYLLEQLSKLNLDDNYQINFRREERKGIVGTRVEIIVDEQKFQDESSKHKLNNENLHAYQDVYKNLHHDLHHKNHDIKHDHAHDNHHNHSHDNLHEKTSRNLPEIEKIIKESDLSLEVKNRSIKMFELLAQAEGAVHGVGKDKVHFHEVGALDAILDIVGAAICLEYLQVDRIISSSVELGGGFISCAHGLLPVPAPAVVQLLQGVPVKTGRVKFETTTPTGAAILAANVEEFSDRQEFIIDKVGYGVGQRDLEIPNVLRVYLGTYSEEHKARSAKGNRSLNYMLETNLDDMNPEYYEFVEERLYSAGAIDIFKTPIIMKKSRPGVKLSILTTAERAKAVEEVIFKETTTIGLRKYPVEKRMIPRTTKVLETQYGPVAVKYSYYNGQAIKAKPEYEDCKRIAREKGIALAEVYQEINSLIYKELDKELELIKLENKEKGLQQ